MRKRIDSFGNLRLYLEILFLMDAGNRMA